MRQHSPIFTVTPQGVMMDGMPLTKSVSRNLLPQTLRYIKRAEELLAKVKPEDWNNRTPHATHAIPMLAQAKMMAALGLAAAFPAAAG